MPRAVSGMIAVLGAITCLTASVEINAAPRAHRVQTTRELQHQWLAMESECRGGQHEPGDAVCRARDRIVHELERRGICWAYRDIDVPPPDYDWHPCSQPRPKEWKG